MWLCERGEGKACWCARVGWRVDDGVGGVGGGGWWWLKSLLRSSEEKTALIAITIKIIHAGPSFPCLLLLASSPSSFCSLPVSLIV